MTELIERQKEKVEKRHERAGNTVIISSSVSREFKSLMDEFNLSPTEIIRKGTAVSLYDMGAAEYMTQTNQRRSDFVKMFEEKLKKMEKEWKSITNFMHLVDEMIKLRPFFEEAIK